MILHPSSVCPSATDQLCLPSLQADLNHLSSVACLWWGIDDISFSWKYNENVGCYSNNKVCLLRLTMGKCLLSAYSFSFVGIFLKLADKMDMDEILDKTKK